MDTKVIGAVGEIGSGKDEVLKYLYSKYGVEYFSTGDIVRQIAESQGMEPTRENLGIISERCFNDLAQYGKGCFVRMVAEEIIKRKLKIAGVSGIRSPDDVRVMQDFFGDGFILIWAGITDRRLRYERILLRHEERDPVSYEEFLKQDDREEQVFNISRTGRMARYSLNNDGSVQDLHREIDRLVAEKKLLEY
ncbi:MAG: AAA family ATPase [Dehalococcoidia bacterium]|nr:AAA family ATPase [Dehalococcoidia bacterium]